MSIICIDRQFHHHGEHSGYGMLAHYLEAETISVITASWLLDTLPQKLLHSYLHLHPNWYSKDALLVEWEISKRLFAGEHHVYHFLYGENSFRRTGRVNSLLRRKNTIVATYHQIPRFFEARQKLFTFLGDLDAVVLVSTNQRPFFESKVNPGNIYFIPHGVDTNFFSPPRIAIQPRESHKCLTVGSNYRDIDLHLNAIQELNKTVFAKNLEFVIVGEARFAPVFSGICNVIYKSDISDDQLLQAYRDADLLLMPLEETTANNAILEGMACGLPIVVTDVGGIRDYVDEAFARIVPPHNTEAMVESVVTLLDDFELRKSMGESARKAAEEKFDWNIVADHMRNLYHTLNEPE